MIVSLLLLSALTPLPVQDESALTAEALIEKLGSNLIEEREEAARALLKMGERARKALIQATSSSNLETQDQAKQILATLDQNALLDELLSDYKSYGLPLPPADAPLVAFNANSINAFCNKLDVRPFTLGFLRKRKAGNDPAVVFWGIGDFTVRQGTVREALPTPDAGRRLTSEREGTLFPLNAGLATALQCKNRGWDALARTLWDESLRQPAGCKFWKFHQPADLPPKSALAFLAWAYCGEQLHQPAADRAAILRRMKTLVATESRLDIEAHRMLIADLESTIEGTKAKPGSAEALIDTFIDFDGDESSLWFAPDPRHRDLIGLGFEAVPVLLAHLGDSRLTRIQASEGVYSGPPKPPSGILRVGGVVFDVLIGFAGEENVFGPDRVGDGDSINKWWSEARKECEEDYLKQHLFPSKPEGGLNRYVLCAISRKYPEDLIPLYRTLLDNYPKLYSGDMAEYVASSRLPKEKIIDILGFAARHTEFRHRSAALRQLQHLDPSLYETLFVEALNTLPVESKEARGGLLLGDWAHLVTTSDSEPVWKAFDHLTQRCNATSRIFLIEHLSCDKYRNISSKRCLIYLIGLLDDTTLLDASSDPDGAEWARSRGFSKIEIRNLAARTLGRLLNLDEAPASGWTDGEWKAFRERTKAAATR